MRLSLAELKKQAQGVVTSKMLQTIQGGSDNSCQSGPPAHEDLGLCIMPGAE